MTARSRMIAPPLPNGITLGCGRSSGVERNLAKVEVESSNLFARSIFFRGLQLESSSSLFNLQL